ncbi:MAG: hypothetical protein AB1778_04530 [Candidatus Bipolaricaulota bacterium]
MTHPTAAPFAAGGPPASTLFLVPPRVDRLALGRTLIGPLLSERALDVTWAQRGVHPDVSELVPAEGRGTVGIEQVRDVLRVLQFSPLQADRKGCLVPRAEDLTPEAANALLKSLEEPTRGATFVLLAENASDLLPTLVSRSQVRRVRSETGDERTARLEAAGYSPSDARVLERLVDRPGELDAFLSAPENLEVLVEQASSRAASAAVTDLIGAAVSGDPIARRASLVVLLRRAASRDPGLLTVGVTAIAGQERPTVVLFLADLLAAAADLARRAAAEGDRAGSWERACQAVDRAHRALAAFVAVDAVVLNLFLSLGGRDAR